MDADYNIKMLSTSKLPQIQSYSSFNFISDHPILNNGLDGEFLMWNSGQHAKGDKFDKPAAKQNNTSKIMNDVIFNETNGKPERDVINDADRGASSITGVHSKERHSNYGTSISNTLQKSMVLNKDTAQSITAHDTVTSEEFTMNSCISTVNAHTKRNKNAHVKRRAPKSIVRDSYRKKKVSKVKNAESTMCIKSRGKAVKQRSKTINKFALSTSPFISNNRKELNEKFRIEQCFLKDIQQYSSDGNKEDESKSNDALQQGNKKSSTGILYIGNEEKDDNIINPSYIPDIDLKNLTMLALQPVNETTISKLSGVNFLQNSIPLSSSKAETNFKQLLSASRFDPDLYNFFSKKSKHQTSIHNNITKLKHPEDEENHTISTINNLISDSWLLKLFKTVVEKDFNGSLINKREQSEPNILDYNDTNSNSLCHLFETKISPNVDDNLLSNDSPLDNLTSQKCESLTSNNSSLSNVCSLDNSVNSLLPNQEGSDGLGECTPICEDEELMENIEWDLWMDQFKRSYSTHLDEEETKADDDIDQILSDFRKVIDMKNCGNIFSQMKSVTYGGKNSILKTRADYSQKVHEGMFDLQQENLVSTLGWCESSKKEPVSSTHMLHWSYCRMTDHLLDPTRESFKCPLCSYKSPRKGHVERHILVHSGEKNNYKEVHVEEDVHVPSFRKYKCEKCSYSANKKIYLERHLLLHERGKVLTCSLCQEKYENKMIEKEVESAEQFDTSVEFIGDYQRNITSCHCKLPRKTDKMPVRKIKVYSQDRPYPCPRCSYRATKKSLLDKHFKVHTGERPFPCPLCRYRASRKAHLLRHMRTHQKELEASIS